MKKFSTESLDDLEKGIKQLLLEDRCSFSVDDRALLNDCLELVISSKTGSKVNAHLNVDSLTQIVELLIKLLYAGDHIKHIF